MADLISSNDEPQEMAKQVEAIAEAAAQRDSQIAQMLNLVPKAAALSTAASRAINFTKKTWVDDPTSGTPITAADMNRLEQAIVDLNTTLTSVQDSVSHRLLTDDESHGIWLDVCGKIGVIRIDTRRSIQVGVFDYIAALPDGILPLSSAADGEIGEYGVAASGSGGIVRVYIRGDDGRIGFFSTTAVSGIVGSVPVILM